jgi:hypothetical protein
MSGIRYETHLAFDGTDWQATFWWFVGRYRNGTMRFTTEAEARAWLKEQTVNRGPLGGRPRKVKA